MQENNTKKLFIVGNGKVFQDYSSLIDSADWVIRFNELDYYNVNTGTKTNIWVVSSNPILLKRQIDNIQFNSKINSFARNLFIDSSILLLFSIPPFIPSKISSNSTKYLSFLEQERKSRKESVALFLTHFGLHNHTYKIVEFPLKYVTELKVEQWSPIWMFPSNGYLITKMILEDFNYSDHQKYLVGFSWEGWQGHPWSIEKNALENLEREGLLKILR